MTITRMFTREELDELEVAYGGSCVVHTEQIDERRWYSIHYTVFRGQDDGLLWRVKHFAPLTELQEHDAWEDAKTVEAVLVEPYEVTVTKYRPVAQSEKESWVARHPEASCGRCHGPNVSWSAPSPLWNAVIRGGDINGNELYGGIVCPNCFAALAEEAGIAERWRLDAEQVHVELATVTPSGRVWNPQTWLWEDRPEASGSPAFGTRLRDAFTWPQTCPNVSFYGRRCELPPHGWDRSCMFTPDREDEYDLADGSTLKDLLEALTAGGRVAVSAAMRWNEYRLHSQAVEAGRLFGMDHTVTRGRWLAVESAKGQREILLGYLGRRVAEGVPSDAGSGAQREQLIQDEEAVAEGEGEP